MSPISIHDAYALRLIKESFSDFEGLPIPRLPPNLSAHERESKEDVARVLGQFDKALLACVDPPPKDTRPRIGIIGAGAAGLYAAMILESLDLSFEILEASDHVGGRLLTHKLGDGKNAYYDVGAMRFPDNPIMDRLFDLFKRLNFTKENGKLINYYMSTSADKYLYNNISAPASALQPNNKIDTFGFSVARGGTVPQAYFEEGHQHWIDIKIDWLRDLLKEDFEGEGWKALMSVDRHSMRSYMALSDDTDPSKKKYPNSVITWCETLDVGTGMYDNALSEAVIDSLDFDYDDDVAWYAVQGGAEDIAIAMAKTLKASNQPVFNKRVVGIYPKKFSPFDNTEGGVDTTSDTTFKTLAVRIEDERWAPPRYYEHVISTIPFGMLRLVDTRACGFSYALDEAIRSLKYDASVKVAIKFSERWWERAPYNQKGGLSKTDRPTRVVVYPSYGIDGKDAVLLASYSWSQDALRFGSLVQGNTSAAEGVLIDIILRDISDIHGIRLSKLKEMVRGHDAWDWYHYEYSSGAFAMFGPGQFQSMYPEVTRPAAGGRLHFAGEAASANHAWVVGALNSAYRCVHEILVEKKDEDRLAMLKEKWGHVDEVNFEYLVRQVAVGIHESSKLAKDVQIEQTPILK